MVDTPKLDLATAPTLEAKIIKLSPVPSIPKPVLQACKRFSAAGYKAWLAGGCVRDSIMGRKPRDWDVVTDAPLDKIREFFPEHLEIGAAFGIIKLPPTGPKTEPVNIDIAIFRKEGSYSDLRHPDQVDVGDEQTDVVRRDFTVNALYLNPETGEVIDYVGGHKDITSKLLKAVGDPNKRFSEDALRILRAVRFSAQLGFKIEKETANALRKNGLLLKAISRERVRDEVFRLLLTSRPVMGLEALMQNGLWEMVFGAKRLSLPADLRQFRPSWNPPPLQWICGLGVTGLFGDPIKEPDEIVKRLTASLRLSNQEVRVLSRALKVYEDSSEKPSCLPGEWLELATEDKSMTDMIKAFVRRARGPSSPEKTKALALIDQTLRWAAKPQAVKSWPSAEVLMKEGLKPGPKLGTELKARQWKVFWTTKPA